MSSLNGHFGISNVMIINPSNEQGEKIQGKLSDWKKEFEELQNSNTSSMVKHNDGRVMRKRRYLNTTRTNQRLELFSAHYGIKMAISDYKQGTETAMLVIEGLYNERYSIAHVSFIFQQIDKHYKGLEMAGGTKILKAYLDKCLGGKSNDK